MSIRVRNWRDQAPYVGHISALVWTLYQSHDKDETSPPEINRLHGINSFVKHGLQGHQHSDHHRHDNIEQLYFILRGRGQLLIGDDKVDVRDGTAVYMPVNVPHQAFNDGEGWMEHLIVSCPLDEIREGTPAVRDWRDVHPVVLEGGTVSWPLLRREEEAPASEGGVLQRVQSVTRYAVQGRQGTAWQQLDGIELVHYVLSGFGIIEDLDGGRQLVTEGSAAHVLPGVAHRFANQGESWLEYVTFAVEVGEVETPDESDESEEAAEPEESPAQYGMEEVAEAAVVAEVDWDDAEAVETEEEIEENGADDDVESAEAEDEAVAVDGVGDDAESAEAEEETAEGEDDSDEADDLESAEAEDEVEDAAELGVDDEADVDGIDGEDGEDVVEADEEDAETTEDEVDAVAEAEAEADADIAEVTDDDEAEVEDAVAAEDEEEELEEADDTNQATEKAEADDDDFDLGDDDADFDIEDETVLEDETGEDDDVSPDTDRR